MPGKLIPFPQGPRRQPGAKADEEPFRVVFEIGESRFAIDRFVNVTDLPSRAEQVIPIRKLRYRKGNRRLAGSEASRVEPDDHDPVEELVFVPAAEPTHAPAVELVAYRGRLAGAAGTSS